MIAPFYCNGCGKRLEIPPGYAKSKMRCEDCGVFSEIPKEIREQGQVSGDVPDAKSKTVTNAGQNEESAGYEMLSEPEVEKAKPRRIAATPRAVDEDDTEEIPERETLISGTQDDDLNPYTVTGDAPTKLCPECDRRIEKRSKVCVHCGHNFVSGQKSKRTFEPVEKVWVNGWPFEKRLMLFVAFQVINFVTLIASQVQGFSFSVSFMLIVMTIGFQAFLIGTYDTLTLTRTAKGKVTISTMWRYAFITRPAQPVKWKEHESVRIVQSNEFDPVDWAMAFILLGYCVVPGILFWWFVIHKDKFSVMLCKDHGYPETSLFRTLDPDRAKEILTCVSDVTTLPVAQ